MRQITKLTNFVITEENRKKIKKFLQEKSRRRRIQKALKLNKSQLTDIYNICLKHVSPVTLPLALISQVQRSGGTLLSQLFDGHPEVHAHPYELKIGYPKKYYWPQIDLNADPETWFLLLFEDVILDHVKSGYSKFKRDEITYPFLFLPSLQYKIFTRHLESLTEICLRDIFDAYMTSYFNAWLNNTNSLNDNKKHVIAFTARLSVSSENMKAFFRIYPEGRLISLVRDPKNWFPSASRHRPKRYSDLEKGINQWLESARASIRNKEKYGEQVCIIRFEDLIAKTDSVMRYLSDFLGISFNDIMLRPTFNRSPIRANTSFELEKEKIVDSTLYRYKTLSPEDLNMIQTMTAKDYERVLEKSVQFTT
jgi:hypothetical protein